MSLWTKLFGPSATDRLIAFMREQQAEAREERAREAQERATAATAQATLTSEMVKAVTTQSQGFQEYLKLIGSYGQPQVRVMDDTLERGYEKKRLQESREALKKMGVDVEAPLVDQFGMFNSFGDDLESLKAQIDAENLR